MANDRPKRKPAYAAWLILLGGFALFAGVLLVRWTSVRPSPLESLIAAGAPEQHIHSMGADESGTLYLGTHLGLLHSADGRTWTDTGMVRGDVQSVSTGAQGTLYLAGPEIGVQRIAGGRAEKTLDARVSAAAASSGKSSQLVALEGRRVWTSRDAGSTWNQAGDLPESDIYAVALAPSEPELWVAGGLSGQVYLSGDGGFTWVPGGSMNGTITSLAFEPRSPHRLWAAAGGQLWVSSDSGRTWSALRDRTGGRDAVALALRPDKPGRALAVTADGYLFEQTE